ncbi:hypothetical protein [Archaeoglobus neptunius]|uniref:hypothetical protein n=1 Tax=Archaeoglobus neptunius TaxID=2798580 RepID=UPI0019252229|nr:hypothetical protein [Archaeoglobus neptunius]
MVQRTALAFLLLLAFVYIFIAEAASTELISYGIVKKGDEYFVNGSGELKWEIGIENISRVSLIVETSDVSGTVVLERYDRIVKTQSLNSGTGKFNFLLPPGDYTVYIILTGRGTVMVKKNVEEIKSDFAYKTENYSLYLLNVSKLAVGEKFSFDLISFSKEKMWHILKVESAGCKGQVMFWSYPSASKHHYEFNCFKIPGIYTVTISGDGWSYDVRVTAYPGNEFLILMGTLAIIFAGTYAARRHIHGLSVGQKLVYISIVLLILSAVVLSFYGEDFANSLAIIAYYFLTLGVINLLIEYRSERAGWLRGSISLLVVAYLIHISPEVLKFLPHTDYVLAITAIIIEAYLLIKSK